MLSMIPANTFNQFFYSTFVQSDYLLPSQMELPPTSQLSNIQVTSNDVFDVLKSLDPSKA